MSSIFILYADNGDYWLKATSLQPKLQYNGIFYIHIIVNLGFMSCKQRNSLGLSANLVQTEISQLYWIECHDIFHRHMCSSMSRMSPDDSGEPLTFPLVQNKLLFEF